MAPCSVTPKVCLTVLTLIYWVAAASLIYIGSWVYMEYENYEELAKAMYTLVPATILLAVGVLFFILSLVGCIGALKEQKCLLGVYFAFLMIILCSMVAAAALGWVYRHDVKSALEKTIHEGMEKYNDTVWRDQIDFMQQELKCCGSHNYTDWQDTPYGKKHTPFYPPSCCANNTCTVIKPGNDTGLYEQGCYTKLETQFLSHLAWIIGTASVFALLQIIGMICACLLCRQTRDEPPYTGLISPEHMRV